MSASNKNKRKASIIETNSSISSGSENQSFLQSEKTKNNSADTRQRSKKVVQVFECPSAFPGARSTSMSATSGSIGFVRTPGAAEKSVYSRGVDGHKRKTPVVNFYEAAQEVRELGSSTWQGYQRKLHLEEKYTEVTGLQKKRQKRPVKILWGMEKKQAQRKARAEDEARAAGIVTPKDTLRKKEKEHERSQSIRKSRSLFGPTPSVGHMNHGILRVHKKLPPKT